jgi:hypothetical protein
VKKSLQWKIHNISETRHLNTWTALGLSIELPTTAETPLTSPVPKNSSRTPTFFHRQNTSAEAPAEATEPEISPMICTPEFSATVLKWRLSLASSEEGSELMARLALLSPHPSTLTYKVTVKIGRGTQLPLCPTMSLPREISSRGGAQAWKILPMEQLCSPNNGLISEDALELFIDLVCYGSRAEGERGQVQFSPSLWNKSLGLGPPEEGNLGVESST